MASTSLRFSSPQLQFPHFSSSSKLSGRPIKGIRIRSSLSDKPKLSAPEPTKLAVRKVPGDYGVPIIGPMKDRWDYFYNQGKDEFFKSRSQKYQSTIFRTNMPPGPFISSNSKVIVLLDGKSFPVLFDLSKVEKKNLFTGTYMPSTDLTGGYRILSYLDPSEPNHSKLKKLMFFLLQNRRDHVIPEFHSSFTELFDSMEKELGTSGKGKFNDANDQASFNFLARSLLGTNPADTSLGVDAPKLISIWVLFQLSPLLTLGLPKLLEELTIRTFRLPPFIIKKNYQRLYDFFYSSCTDILTEAEKLGVTKDEACHNILFATCFNSFGGMKIFFPNMLKWIGRGGVKLHTELAQEIRSVVKSNGGKVTMGAMEKMELMKSCVYETLRIEPPVPAQYGKAKKDFLVESHDGVFQVKEGEMLFGFQPFATKDPKIFDKAEEFVPDRFVGEEGERLLRYVLWSNGPETESPSVANKQCAGKDFVVLASRLLLVELFLRYDSFEIQVSKSPLGSAVTLTSLKRASF